MARISEAVNIRKALDIYLKASGQKINDDNVGNIDEVTERGGESVTTKTISKSL